MRLFAVLSILTITMLLTHGVASGDEPSRAKQSMLLVVGAEGNEEYGEMFRSWADKWRAAARRAEAEFAVIGAATESESDRELLAAALSKTAEAEYDRFWLVLIGHGTYDDAAAKFNLRGKDVTAKELSAWLSKCKAPTVVINCASSSGPFVNSLAAEDRVVVTATKSGYEINFARFGKYLASAIDDPEADLDKDDQVSLLEAYLTASRQVDEYYEQDAQLAQEHALLDDNGDGLGTPASWFRGVRAAQRAKAEAELDGAGAHRVYLVQSDREANMAPGLRQRRDALEIEIETLRQQKETLTEADYYERLGSVMLQLAQIYETVEHPDPNLEEQGVEDDRS